MQETGEENLSQTKKSISKEGFAGDEIRDGTNQRQSCGGCQQSSKKLLEEMWK